MFKFDYLLANKDPAFLHQNFISGNVEKEAFNLYNLTLNWIIKYKI